jgi:2-oxoglutarate ferredoxin oxidoreductase subunit beta
MTTENDYDNDAEKQWCPGCPNFGILKAFKSAFTKLGKAPHEICLISGIGQAAKLPHYLRCNFFNGLHGRAIPVALGVHSVNPELSTIVVTGDGDCYGEGGNHFIHALRRNPNITVVVHNNEIYALTKGQASPTTKAGEKRTLHMNGVDIAPLKALSLAIVHNCGFVARGFAGNVDHLSELLAEAINYRGLSLVDVIQPCITWGTHSLKWYKERVFQLEDDYDATKQNTALSTAMEWEDRMPIGVIYKGNPDQGLYGQRFRESVTDTPLSHMSPVAEEQIKSILSEFRPGG